MYSERASGLTERPARRSWSLRFISDFPAFRGRAAIDLLDEVGRRLKARF